MATKRKKRKGVVPENPFRLIDLAGDPIIGLDVKVGVSLTPPDRPAETTSVGFSTLVSFRLNDWEAIVRASQLSKKLRSAADTLDEVCAAAAMASKARPKRKRSARVRT
jgi:hypothetical protein